MGESAAMETPVLIVGAGPIGQLAALLLSHQGIASTIVERRIERMTAPKAHAVNPRTLEICAGLGLPIDEIYELATPPELGGWVQFMSRLAGVSFGALPYERQDEAVRSLTPYPLANIAQPRFEEILSRAINDRPDISVLRGCTCAGLDEDNRGVNAQVTVKGIRSPLQIRADYVLAADGAGSRLRDMLGIAMDGPEALQYFMMIHFNADLTALVKDNPGILYFLFDPDAWSALIAYDQADNWVLMHNCDPADHDVANFDEPACRALIEQAVGQPVTDLKLRNVSPWVMSSQVAQQYRRGRVFLIGDAAHRFPPTGGLGLNTGAGDAQNICWKIAAVIKGWAGHALFDSYEPERKQVAEFNSVQSMNNAAKIFELHALLYGPDPAKQREYFDNYCATSLDSDELKSVVEAQRAHFDSLALQLGYRYAVDGADTARAMDMDISDFRPEYAPGFRFPHSWVMREGEQASLLNLLPVDRFSLVVCAGSEAWQDILADVDLPIACLVEGVDFSGVDVPWSEQGPLRNTAALLVRPDGHIAAIFERSVTAEAALLNQIFSRQLCREDILKMGAA